MLKKVKTFQSLTTQQRQLFFQAYGFLGAMRFALLTRPFKSLVEGLELHREVPEQPSPGPVDLATAQNIGWAVRKAAQYTPWQSTCLVQVLAAQRMLQKREIAGVFYIGASTQDTEGQEKSLAAHAWLKCGQDFITGESGHGEYTVVSCFSWT